MKKGIKKVMVGALALTMLLGMGTVSFAKNDKTDQTKTEDSSVKVESQDVSKVTCTASGKLNVSFKGKVTYTDALKAVITDEEGKEIKCNISKKNASLLTVSVAGLVKGQKYTLTVEGILAKNADEPATIVKTFIAKGMKTACKVSKVSVAKKKFVTIKMKSSAYYKDASVVVNDVDGNVYDAKIIKKAKGNIKVQITGLKKGTKYTITISGVKTKKEKNFSSITKTFVAK